MCREIPIVKLPRLCVPNRVKLFNYADRATQAHNHFITMGIYCRLIYEQRSSFKVENAPGLSFFQVNTLLTF